MRLPQPSEYQSAIQHPKHFLRDAQLKRCQPELDANQVPKPRAGGFAVTFKMSGPDGDWAVRCFHRPAENVERRYRALSAFTKQRKTNRFLDFDFQNDGIVVNGQPWPIVKMRWGNGLTLNEYLAKHHGDRDRIKKLGERFRALVAELRALGVAHGDLQGGNLLVTDDDLWLIDYDGIVVPSTTSLPSEETGHSDFQSPLRDATWKGPELDHFSSVVIHLGLMALHHDPRLWAEFSNGNNILFKKTDFDNPSQSPLFRKLASIGGLKKYSESLKDFCILGIHEIPHLDDAIPFSPSDRPSSIDRSNSAGMGRTPSQQIPLPVDKRDSIPTCRADLPESVLAHAGRTITLFGRVARTTIRENISGGVFGTVYFESYWPSCARLQIGSQIYDAFVRTHGTLSSLKGKWVTVRGKLETYLSSGEPSPSISITDQALCAVTTSEQLAKVALKQIPTKPESPFRARVRANQGQRLSDSVLPPRRSTGSSAPVTTNDQVSEWLSSRRKASNVGQGVSTSGAASTANQPAAISHGQPPPMIPPIVQPAPAPPPPAATVTEQNSSLWGWFKNLFGKSESP